MLAIILLLALLALILFGVGFTVHFLWIVAVIVLAILLIGFLFRVVDGGGRGWYGRRW